MAAVRGRACRWHAAGWMMLVVAVTCVWGGCANRIEMKPQAFRLGMDVDRATGDLSGADNAFTTETEQVVAWAEFANAFGTHTARFRWLNDEKELVHDSGIIRVAPDDKLYAYRRVWSTLPVQDAPASLMPGKWRVEIYFDDERVETLKFRIREE